MKTKFRTPTLTGRRAVTALLGTTSVAGVVLLVFFVTPASEPAVQLYLGLSAFRLSIAALFLLVLLASIGATALSAARRWPWQEGLENRAKDLVTRNLIPILAALYVVAALTGAAMLVTLPPLPAVFHFLEPVRARLIAPIAWLLIVSVTMILLVRSQCAPNHRELKTIALLDGALLLSGIFLVTFVLYEQIATSIGWVGKSRYSYWNWLAEAFLEGRLDLPSPPTLHDLTFYRGRWYVPNPPVPALLMMPLVALLGAENVSTGDLSMGLSALNSVLVFAILREFGKRQWLRLSTGSALLVVALFAFGTPHLWVGISGRMWFVSQILTVTFLALGALATLKALSPWLVGISLGLAVGTRPNAILFWPFVFAVAMQIAREMRGVVDFRQALRWSLRSFLPIGIAIGGLLLYNQARFDNMLDFGYAAINGDPEIVKNAQTYGLFSPRYVAYNLRVMLFYLPEFRPGGRWPILPSGAGMSMLLATPALVYLFHRYPANWWTTGAWTAVGLSFLLLAFYHNSGRDQFGYRYILDSILPLLALLASAFGRRLPWHFIALLLLSICINLYGANWFMNG